MVFKHEIKDLKVRGGKNHVDKNVSVHGTCYVAALLPPLRSFECFSTRVLPDIGNFTRIYLLIFANIRSFGLGDMLEVNPPEF